MLLCRARSPFRFICYIVAICPMDLIIRLAAMFSIFCAFISFWRDAYVYSGKLGV